MNSWVLNLPKDFTGLQLGDEFSIVSLISRDNHGDLYAVKSNTHTRESCSAKAIDLTNCTPALRTYRQKHLKRLRATSSFVGVIDDHNLKWIIRRDGAPVGPPVAWHVHDSNIDSLRPRDRKGSDIRDGILSLSEGPRVKTPHSPDNGNLAQIPGHQADGGELILQANGTKAGLKFGNIDHIRTRAATLVDRSVSSQDSGDVRIGSSVSGRPSKFQPPNLENKATDGKTSIMVPPAVKRVNPAKKEKAKTRWRKNQRSTRRLNKAEKLEGEAELFAILHNRNAAVQVLLPLTELQVAADITCDDDISITRPANALQRFLDEQQRPEGRAYLSSTLLLNPEYLGSNFPHSDRAASAQDFDLLFSGLDVLPPGPSRHLHSLRLHCWTDEYHCKRSGIRWQMLSADETCRICEIYNALKSQRTNSVAADALWLPPLGIRNK